jgi:hypothetical protein
MTTRIFYPVTCANCGLPQSQWQPRDVKGYTEDEQRYCCEGCEQGTGCTCQSATADTGD